MYADAAVLIVHSLEILQDMINEYNALHSHTNLEYTSSVNVQKWKMFKDGKYGNTLLKTRSGVPISR